MPISLPIYITAFVFTIIVFIFTGLWHRKKIDSINHYFVIPHVLSSRQLYSTFMGSSLSLASMVLVFMAWGAEAGLAALWAPIAWAAGILVLRLCLVPILRFTRKYITLHGFLQQTYGTTRIRRFAAVATLIGFLGQFGVEVLIGATLFTTVKEDTVLIIILGIALLGTIVVYSWTGGILAVLRSDEFQYWMVRIGLVVAAVYIISSKGTLNAFLAELHTSFQTESPPFHPLFDWGTVLALWCLNLPLLITDMSVWQRLACIQHQNGENSAEKVARSAVKSFLVGLLLMSLLIVVIGL